MYALLLILGFCCQLVPRLGAIPWGGGVSTFLWFWVYLELTSRFRRRRQLVLTGLVFVLGYNLQFAGAMGTVWINLVLFSLFGLLLYAAFCVSAGLMIRWQNLPGTLIFPAVWLLEYFLATGLRFPALVRVDMMFTDMPILMRSEAILGSAGLSFLLLWMISLLRLATARHRLRYVTLAVFVYLGLLLPGVTHLFPNRYWSESLRVAYTTGPFGGDFLDYEAPSYEVCEESLENSVKEAAAQQAEILVFNEEAFEMDDSREGAFIAKCGALAREHGLALLVGLDIKDTDGSENGKAINKLVFVGPDGQPLGSYQKYRLLPILEAEYEAGDGQIPYHTLELGGKQVRISYLICYDSNFPSYVNKMEKDTDILFLPSWDWSAVTELHARLCCTLASENHISVLKPTYDGRTIAVNPDGEIFHSTSTVADGYETVHVVEMPIKSSYAEMDADRTLSPLTYAGIGAEILAALLGLMLLIGNEFVSSEKTRKTRMYSALVSMNSIACACDAISWILDGSSRLHPILYVTSVISLIATFIIIGCFIEYFMVHVRERKAVSSLPQKLYWIFCLAAVAFTLITSATGDLFVFEAGKYEEKPLYTVYLILNIFSMLFATVVVTIYRKLLVVYAQVVSYAYLLMPIFSAGVNVVVEDWSFAYPTTTMSLVLIYVLLQSDRLEQIANERRIISHYASHDELTGLKNRRAFRDELEALMNKAGTSGIIFSDVNGLKYVNDNFGHEAGDELLTKYSQLLLGIFRQSEIYRISGDEYVCMLENVSEEIFSQRVRELEERLAQDAPPMACVGAVFGSNAQIENMLKKAEENMYVQKELVHARYPRTRRL